VPRILTFSDGFTSSTAPTVTGASEETYTLNNNQSTTNISGLLIDPTDFTTAFFNYELERIGSSTYRQSGQFQIVWNGSSFSLSFGPFDGDNLMGIDTTLSVLNSGQFQYSTVNLTGHTSSKLKIFITRISA